MSPGLGKKLETSQRETETRPPVGETLAISSKEMKYVHVLGIPWGGKSKNEKEKEGRLR